MGMVLGFGGGEAGGPRGVRGQKEHRSVCHSGLGIERTSQHRTDSVPALMEVALGGDRELCSS